MNRNWNDSKSFCCNVCPIFKVGDGGTNEPLDVQLNGTQLKGTGNANAVFGTTRGDGLVVRCRLRRVSNSRSSKGSGNRDDHDHGNECNNRNLQLLALEERMWSRRDLATKRDTAEDQLMYASRIVAPLLGVRFLPLSRRLENVSFDTPPRTLKDSIVTDSGILMTDGTLLVGKDPESVVCLELKPKFGGIVRCDTVPHQHRHLKHVKSRYQLHQALKLEQNRIDRRSAYDPLDLFSNDSSRMQRAVEALMECPQNNLAVFLGGVRVQPEEAARGLDRACEILQCGSMACLASAVQSILAWEGILRDLLRMQTLCEYDVHAVEALLRQMLDGDQKRIGEGRALGENGGSVDGTTAFLERMAASSEAARLDVLADYCTSATAKDCSILVSMTRETFNDMNTSGVRRDDRIKQGNRPCELGLLGGIAYRVTVVDLDKKSLKKLKAHKQLDENIMRANLISEANR